MDNFESEENVPMKFFNVFGTKKIEKVTFFIPYDQQQVLVEKRRMTSLSKSTLKI